MEESAEEKGNRAKEKGNRAKEKGNRAENHAENHVEKGNLREENKNFIEWLYFIKFNFYIENLVDKTVVF